MTQTTETLHFQAEVKQLLQLMIHALYSNKEIFLRELISNASDALDKLRFSAIQDAQLYEGDGELKIQIEVDKTQRVIHIRDNGIGMTRDEVVSHIGTIARSGTKEFLANLSGDESRDSKLIGQFGVGFYSAFIVAERVELVTRKAGAAPQEGVRWLSRGEGEYQLEAVAEAPRGTCVSLYLRADEDEFLDVTRLRSIVRKFSDHIAFPIQLRASGTEAEWEMANQASALWQRPKKEITEAEYHEFYKHVAHDFETPLVYLHQRIEGKQDFTLLLYVPSRAPFDLWDRDSAHGVRLYVKRVFILEDNQRLLPRYLRFIRGVVDSDDLPLNVSRELLQENKLVEGIRSAATKRVLNLLEDLAKEQPLQYQKFWQTFGKVIKEGLAEDHGHREQLARLLRFASTQQDTAEQTVSLADYVGRMQPGQEKIYYIVADTFAAAKNSPHLELLRKQGIEALLMYERIDEWLVSYLSEFEGKTMQSVARGALDLPQAEAPPAAEVPGELPRRVQEALGERVKEVRFSHRLTESPACLVSGDYDMSGNMQRILKAIGQEIGDYKPILELNPQHPLIQRLEAETEAGRFADLAQILFDQALLSEGGQLDDPASYVKRLNMLLLALSQPTT